MYVCVCTCVCNKIQLLGLKGFLKKKTNSLREECTTYHRAVYHRCHHLKAQLK